MNHNDLSVTLNFLAPTAEFVLTGEPIDAITYATAVQWLSDGEPPVWEAVIAAVDDALAEAAIKQQAENALSQRAELERLRLAAFQTESDPLFFKWQRGEATQQEWINKVDEIRSRYPYSNEVI